MITPLELVTAAKSSITECNVNELCKAIDEKALIIDLREPSEYQEGFIENAINIPRGMLEFTIFQHPQIKPQLNDDIASTPIYVYCKSGGRSALGAESLQKLGFSNVKSLAGGITNWEKEGLTIHK